jgi:hypothetical protein
MSVTIIHGPRACGKTHNAELFRRKYGHREIIDGWDGRSKLPDDALVLTNVLPPQMKLPAGDVKVIEFSFNLTKP